MSIGERIIQLRTEGGITQAQLAKMMDVSRQAVSKWESDTAAPDSIKLIKLADLLDTDIEYLTTGRRNFGRRPPVVVETVKTVEKVVEKPVVQVVEKVVEKVIESPPVVQYIEKPVVKKVYRTKHIRNPLEFAVVGAICFIAGVIIGLLL